MGIKLERFVIAQVAILPPAIILAHGLAALLRVTFAPEAAPAVCSLALITGLAALLPAAILYRTNNVRLAGYTAGAFGALGGLGVITQTAGSWIPGLSVLIVAPAALYAFNVVARRLPASFDGALKRAPLKAILWGLLGLLAIVQSARLSAWISDSNTDWWLCTRHPFYAQHMCMNAYVQAADLNRQGIDNIYDIQYYPGLNPDADPHTTVANITPEDPYQYPPQFLLLPRLAIAVTNDFYLIKVSWFILQTMFFLLVAWWLARLVGGPRGVTAALLIPAVWVSFPVLSNFQYGQFHLPSIGLAILGMILFSSKRYAIGGAALAAGIIAKIAPGILLVYLLVKKRYREVGWTLGFCAVYTALAYAIVGPEPFRAFFDYHLPRLSSGAAFDFASAWPDFADLIVAGNQSPWGVIYKLGALGVAGMSDIVARGAHILYALGALILAALVARRADTRFPEPLIWLALVNLAGLVSKGAWGDYIAVGTVWALTYLTLEFAGSLKQRIYLAVCWVFLALSLGIMPAPVLIDLPQVMIFLSLIGVITLVSVNVWIALSRPTPARANA